MMLSWTTGDTAPDLSGVVNANLTGATVVVHVKLPDGTVLVKAATVTDAAGGAWSMDWAPGELALAGTHAPEVQVTFSNGKVQTFRLSADGVPATFPVHEQYA